jgi:prepilin-type N-terminal cleavage/methylation domain-containing protein
MPRRAFTLIEILIVVVILAILAVIVLPKFSNVTASARVSMLMDDLRLMRSQLLVFRAQHAGVAAGYPNCDPALAPTEETMVDHITLATTITGEVAPIGTPGYKYGPYMREVPENPINGLRSVLVVANSATFPNSPPNAYGWIYQPATMVFKAACSGTDEDGVPFFDY